jgi:hypothetical protein
MLKALVVWSKDRLQDKSASEQRIPSRACSTSDAPLLVRNLACHVHLAAL